jgi:hypothetical protein
MSNTLEKFKLKIIIKKNRIIKKSLHVKISPCSLNLQFCIFLADFSLDFIYVILSHLDELLGLRYMVGKLQMSCFHPNFNHITISPVAPDISQTVHEGLV